MLPVHFAAWSLALFTICITFEFLLFRKKKGNYYSSRDSTFNVIMGVVALIIDLVIQIVPIYLLLSIQRFSILSFTHSAYLWIISLILWDFTKYWMHRLEHTVWILWSIHSNHHSSSYFNLSTSFRSGVFKSLYRYIFFVPLIILGIPGEILFTVYVLGKTWAFFSHTQLIKSLGILDFIFVSPGHHKMHHLVAKKCLNKNFGEALIVWDKIFGTYIDPKLVSNRLFGINSNVNESNLFDVVFNEKVRLFDKIRSKNKISAKIAVAFGRPD